MITSILAFVVVLGITISIHEFGHFAMAKLLKIRVLVFSLGFGPKLVGFTRGDTEYRLSPIPLGGYVKMAGENYDADRKGTPDEFLSHPKWHRFLVAIAGPLMNIFLAVVIFTVIFSQGVYEPKYLSGPTVVGPVTNHSVAWDAGLQTGDRILSVSGNRVGTWEEMEVALSTSKKDSISLEVQRDDQLRNLTLKADALDLVDSGTLGFKAPLPKTIVNSVIDKSPAAQAGLQPGDQILSVRGEGKTGDTYSQILNIISESEGVPLVFKIFRPDKGTEFDPWKTSPEDLRGTSKELTIAPIEKEGQVLIGFSYDIPMNLNKFGLGTAFVESVRFNYEKATLTFQIIGRMLKGSASVRTLSGPIGIAQISGDAARTHDIGIFFTLVGIISLQLGIFNLLPIPILDGGVIALLLIEGLIRRDLSLGIKEKIVQVGFVFLILLMGFAVFNDLSKIFNFERIFG